MKKLLFASIFFTSAIIVPMQTMSGADMNAGISLPPPIVLEAPPEVIGMPDTSGAYVVADADKTQGVPPGRDEKQQDESLEKRKAAGPEDKPEWKINVWPQKPPDNAMSPHERKEENKHVPPDRFWR